MFFVHTALKSPNNRSHCRGEPQTDIKKLVKEKGFEELLQLQVHRLSFVYIRLTRNRALNDESDMRVSFYLREADHRVRILCRIPHRTRPSEYWCLPLNLLEVLRVGPCLRLCRRRNSGTELVLWTQLKFSTMEGQCPDTHLLFESTRSSTTQILSTSIVRSLPYAPRMQAIPWAKFKTSNSKTRRSIMAGE